MFFVVAVDDVVDAVLLFLFVVVGGLMGGWVGVGGGVGDGCVCVLHFAQFVANCGCKSDQELQKASQV